VLHEFWKANVFQVLFNNDRSAEGELRDDTARRTLARDLEVQMYAVDVGLARMISS
jgi:hypothetical protein